MDDCIFCRIVAGTAEASIVYRDAACTALLTIEPITEGHVLVIPNEHFRDIFELPAAVAARMIAVAKKVAVAYGDSGIRCEGVNLVMCNGAAASQTVFHAHVHVTPRYAGDGFSWNMPPGFQNPPDREQLDHTAAALREAMSCQG